MTKHEVKKAMLYVAHLLEIQSDFGYAFTPNEIASLNLLISVAKKYVEDK